MYFNHIFKSQFMFSKTTGWFWCDGSHMLNWFCQVNTSSLDLVKANLQASVHAVLNFFLVLKKCQHLKAKWVKNQHGVSAFSFQSAINLHPYDFKVVESCFSAVVPVQLYCNCWESNLPNFVLFFMNKYYKQWIYIESCNLGLWSHVNK